ncbi:13900_t:CDS:2, partial [Gigaspora rosea]
MFIPKKKVTKLHKRIAKLQKEVIRYPADLQEELTRLQKDGKSGLILAKLKRRNGQPNATPVNILQYAKETYKKLYKLDRVNLDAITEFSVIDQAVSEEQNYELVKKTIAEEIEEIIKSLVYITRHQEPTKRLAQQLFSNQTVHIADAVLISESFIVECGVQQDDP